MLTQGCTNTLCLSESSAVLQFTNLPIYQFTIRIAKVSVRRHTVAEGLRGAERRREGGEVEACAPLALDDEGVAGDDGWSP